MVKKFALAGAVMLALGSPLAQADGLRSTYLEGGLFIGDSDDYDADEVRFRFRGSFGVGDVLYFPVSVETTALETDDEDFSRTDVTLTGGIGARIPVSETFALYGDASLAMQAVSYDYDGGFDDDDEDDDGTGHLLRGGLRFQPSSLIELNAELSKREIALDFEDEELRRTLVALQFNISSLFSLGVEHHRDRYHYDYDFGSGSYTTRYIGAYARFSFK